MRNEIERRLDLVEREHGVRIVYACESGSRAWGFESEDSDYDVRFIYAHPLDDYLRFDFNGWRDVIEYPVDEDLDVNGWDIRKTLGLYRKPNPTVFEWLDSPIVYRETGGFAATLRRLGPTYYAARTARYHYFHMARGNFRDFLRGDTVIRKKYLYVLRPLLAVRWIDDGRGVVPMRFQELVDASVPEGPLREAIDDLIEAKKSGGELGRAPRIEPISAFIESELETRATLPGTMDEPVAPAAREPLDQLLRDTLREV